MPKVGKTGSLSNTYLPIMVANQMNELATSFNTVTLEADVEALTHDGEYGDMVCAHLIAQMRHPFSVVRVFFSEEENAVCIILASISGHIKTILKCPRDRDFEILSAQSIRLGLVTYNFL